MNVILVDHDVNEEWEYKQALEHETGLNWRLLPCVTNRLHGSHIKEQLRYIKYFIFAFNVFIKRNKYENIIAWQQFYGLLLAFYCRVFRVKRFPNIYNDIYIQTQEEQIL